MAGFGRVHEESRSARAGERCSDLAAYMTGLAHPRNHDAARCVQTKTASFDECIVESRPQQVDRPGFNIEHLACEREQVFVSQFYLHKVLSALDPANILNVLQHYVAIVGDKCHQQGQTLYAR